MGVLRNNPKFHTFRFLLDSLYCQGYGETSQADIGGTTAQPERATSPFSPPFLSFFCNFTPSLPLYSSLLTYCPVLFSLTSTFSSDFQNLKTVVLFPITPPNKYHSRQWYLYFSCKWSPELFTAHPAPEATVRKLLLWTWVGKTQSRATTIPLPVLWIGGGLPWGLRHFPRICGTNSFKGVNLQMLKLHRFSSKKGAFGPRSLPLLFLLSQMSSLPYTYPET